MKKQLLYFFAFLIMISFTSCDDDSLTNGDDFPTPIEQTFTDGVFIINEGNFGTPNGSMSFFRNTDVLEKDIFQNKNNRTLGDVVQSFTIEDAVGYIVVNNDNKMEIVNANTFAQIATVENLHLPRFFLKVSATKAYISNWGNFFDVSPYIAILDLSTNQVTGKIEDAAFSGLEQMALSNGKMYVTNNFGTTVSVIDVATDQVTEHLTVGDAPKRIKLVDNAIWVLTSGSFNFTFSDPTDDTRGRLIKIDPTDNSIDLSLEIGAVGDHPGILETDGSSLFYVNNGNTYKMASSASTLPTTPLISGQFFYGLGVDPQTGNIYGGDANGFTALGAAYVYNSSGTLIQQFLTGGIGPNSFVFVD